MSGFGEVLKMIGEYGAFQKCLVVLLCIPSFLTPFHMFGQIFISIDVPHHCNTSWIRAISPNLTVQQVLNLTIPKKVDGSLEECSRFTPVDSDIESIIKYGLNSTQGCEQGWVYPTMSVPTLVTEFDLVCDQRDLNDISQSIFMGGLLAGSLIFGSLSDRFGSRMSILITLFIMGFFGTAVSLAAHFYVYIALRFVVGAALAGISISIATLSSEWVGPSYRPQALIIIHCANALGQMALAGVAYFVHDWRLYQITTSAPAFLIFFYAWVLPSSARWLITKKKMEEAKDILLRAAAINNQTFSVDIVDQLAPEKKMSHKYILDLFKKSYLRNMTLIMAWVWFVDSLVYYELSLHVGDFGLNIYLTQLIFGAVEIPSRIFSIFLLESIGRKKCQSTWLILGGIMCVIICVIPKEFRIIVTVLAVIGKSAMAASFSTTYLFSAEIFPTVVRQFALGLCSTSARVAGILAPLLGMLARYHLAIPMFICGSSTLVAGILCCFLPETRNRDLQDTTPEPEAAPAQKIQEIHLHIGCELETITEEEITEEGPVKKTYV
ncbi:solute carrier family 22 member 13-like [Protobothrops mucrosquamatus]|uniref:solute carrier family 22 member 13-like n=1 Tax=Protobothrops mucrosquamatus TaxID=103944 RepID=UPI0007759D06|nr:solute carrier family 22 member 13-like [Protobothrops mucrosquamatus]